MKCPVCGAAELIHDIRDLPYTYKGETTVIAAYFSDRGRLFQADRGRRFSAIVDAQWVRASGV